MRAKPFTRKVKIGSKDYLDIINIPFWTRHHNNMEEPLEGEPARELEVFGKAVGKKITSCDVHLNRKKIIAKSIDGIWYETDWDNLEKTRKDALNDNSR